MLLLDAVKCRLLPHRFDTNVLWQSSRGELVHQSPFSQPERGLTPASILRHSHQLRSNAILMDRASVLGTALSRWMFLEPQAVPVNLQR